MKKPDYRIKVLVKSRDKVIDSEEKTCYDFDIEKTFTETIKKLNAKHNEESWFTGSFELYVFEWGNWQKCDITGRISR